jgi:Leucine-rich repeat (LRR) protein
MNISPNRASPTSSEGFSSPPSSPASGMAQRVLFSAPAALGPPAMAGRLPARVRVSEEDAEEREERQQLFERRLAAWEASTGLVFAALREIDLNGRGSNLVVRNRMLKEKVQLPNLFTLIPRLTSLTVQTVSTARRALVSLPRSLIDCPNLKSLTILDKTKVPSWIGRLKLDALAIEGERAPLSDRCEGLGSVKSLSVANTGSRFFESLRRADDLQSLTQTDMVCLPEWLQECAQLTELKIDLHHRMDEPIPDRLGQLFQLTALHVTGEFEQIPESLGALRNLRSLSLAGSVTMSRMRTVPASIVELHRLEFLNLGYNPIEELPAGLFQLPLKTLCLRHSGPLRAIPEQIGDCVSLTDLDLSLLGPRTHLPESLGKLRNLQKLRAHSHGGFLPAGVFALPNLTALTCNSRDVKQLPLRDVPLNDLTDAERVRLLERCEALTETLQHSAEDPDLFLIPALKWRVLSQGEVVMDDEHRVPIAIRSRFGHLLRREILNERWERLEREFELLEQAQKIVDTERARSPLEYPVQSLLAFMTRGVLMQDTALRMRIAQRRLALEEADLLP